MAINENYQLVQAKQIDSSQKLVRNDIISTKLKWKLPPKHLTARSQISFSLSIVIPSMITALFLITLMVLLIQMRLFLPNTEINSYSWVDVPLGYESRLYNSVLIRRLSESPISCDLITANASVFEKVFTIDLRSQLHLSFAVAKFVDVVWNLAIGQRSRLLMTWIFYIVFMNGLARLMETATIFYQLYASIVFETSTFISIWYSLKAVFISHGWRGRAFLTWFGLATMYVFEYSTLMSAATGYLNPSNIRYRAGDNVFISPDSDELTHCLQIRNTSMNRVVDAYVVQGPSDKELDQHFKDDMMISKYQAFITLLDRTHGKCYLHFPPPTFHF